SLRQLGKKILTQPVLVLACGLSQTVPLSLHSQPVTANLAVLPVWLPSNSRTASRKKEVQL
ncbi:MAG: hypothetical protein AAFX57_20980, partial [Bacteroidota bacterium]